MNPSYNSSHGSSHGGPSHIEESEIIYTNLSLIKRCLTENGKIMPARMLKNSRTAQRKLVVAVKRARFLALIPFTVGG